MLEALFTSWILREQRKSSHNSVSDNNRGGKINNYAYLFFLDLLLAWRAYKAAWCISSLLYLPDKKLCCPFLFFRTCDTLCDENWKVAKKFVFSNNFAVISNEFFETFWSKWLQFLKPFFYTFSFWQNDKNELRGHFCFSFQRLGSIASNVFQSTVQILLAKIPFTIIIHQISWKDRVWVDVKAEMVYFLPQLVSNCLAHTVRILILYSLSSRVSRYWKAFSKWFFVVFAFARCLMALTTAFIFPLAAVARIFLTVQTNGCSHEKWCP